MPELPEVETVRRALEISVKNQRFSKIQVHCSHLRYPVPQDLATALQDKIIRDVRRRAKYLLLDFENKLTLIWHLGMSGRVIIDSTQNANIIRNTHDHLVFETNTNLNIIYRDPRRFGFLWLVPTTHIAELKPFNAMGPEPFDVNLNGLILHQRFKDRHISIKSALLNQNIIAGVGNIYASETLWQAKISPYRLASTLNLTDADSILQALRDILKRAINFGGSTLKDHAQPNGEIGYFQNYLNAYNKENVVCSSCQQHPIIKITQNNRATYYCANCQE